MLSDALEVHCVLTTATPLAPGPPLMLTDDGRGAAGGGEGCCGGDEGCGGEEGSGGEGLGLLGLVSSGATTPA